MIRDKNLENSRSHVLTIGYGSRSMPEFIGILKLHKVEFLVDVRSRPYSTYKSEFSQNSLRRSVSKENIKYVFMGDLLGGQPDDQDCYINGKVNYLQLESKDFYQNGIKRLKKAWEGKYQLVLMCSEAKPQECHRTKLIGHSLVRNGISVMHIDENGKIKTQEKVIDILQDSEQQPDLFNSVILEYSRKLYRKKKGVKK